MTLVRLIEGLRAAGLDYSAHESVADLLFLVRHWDLFTATEPPPPAAPPPPKSPPAEANKPETTGISAQTAPQNKDRSSNAKGIFAADSAAQGEGTPAARVGVPDPAALPNPLLVARALRPLARRKVSHRESEFDEEATAERSAQDESFSVIFRPVRERWFEVLLLIEDTVSMAVWQRSLTEFTTLLGSHGAFRDVRCARLRATVKEVEIIDSAGRVRGPRSVLDSEGRRLILIFTHGVTPAWAGGALHRALLLWAAKQPVAIVQMLPSSRWEQTELGEADSSVRALNPGSPNAGWTVTRPEWQQSLHPTGIAVPLLTLQHADVARWARMLMSQAQTSMPAIFISPTYEEPSDTAEAPATASGQAIVARFRTNASPAAWRLAVALAGSPLMMPIMRLVQHTIFAPGEVEQVHLAEILLGGLVRRIHKTDDPESDGFEFLPGVRNLLAESLNVQERHAIRTRVYAYIREHRETMRIFPALVPHKDGRERLPEWAAPFAAEDEQWLESNAIAEGVDPNVRRFASMVTAVAYSASGKLALGFEDGTLEFDGRRQQDRGRIIDIRFWGDEMAALSAGGGVICDPGVRPRTSYTGLSWLAWFRRGVLAYGTFGQGGLMFWLDKHARVGPLEQICTLGPGQFVLVRSHQGAIFLGEDGSEHPIFPLKSRCTALAATNGNKIAAGCENGDLVVWEEFRHGPEEKHMRWSGPITSLAWSADGRLACATGNQITVWASDFNDREELMGHTAPVTSLAWSPDGRLTSASRDKSVRVWNFDRRPALHFSGDHWELERALIARGHPVLRELTDECRVIVLPREIPETDDPQCRPQVRYSDTEALEDIFQKIDTALAEPPAGRLHGFPAARNRFVRPSAESLLRRKVVEGDPPIITVLGELGIGKTELITKVLNRCDVRRRFPGGLYRKLDPPETRTGPICRADKIYNFRRDWTWHEGDVFVLEGTGEEMARYLDGIRVARVELDDDPVEINMRMAKLCMCRVPELPSFVVDAIGRDEADRELISTGLLKETEDGYEVDPSEHARYHPNITLPGIHADISIALRENAEHPFSLRHRLYHLYRADERDIALSLANDVGWLIAAGEADRQLLITDLRALDLIDLAATLERRSDVPLIEALASAPAVNIARSAIRYERASKYVTVAGTGSHDLPPLQLEAAHAVGSALARAGFGLITGAWPGVDYVTARAYLDNGGTSLVHIYDNDSTDRLRGALEVQPLPHEHDRSVKLADAVVLIGGLGGTYDVFTSARRQEIPVFPYGPSGGDAARALAELEVSEFEALHRQLSPAEFSNSIVERLRPDLLQQAVHIFERAPRESVGAFRAALALPQSAVPSRESVLRALDSRDRYPQLAGLALLPRVAQEGDARVVAEGILRDRWSDPQIAGLALSELLKDPSLWDELQELDLAALARFSDSDVIAALASYWSNEPNAKLSPLLRSPDRHKRIFAFQHFADFGQDEMHAYLDQPYEHDEEEERLLGESGLHHLSTESPGFDDEPAKFLEGLREARAEFQSQLAKFQTEVGRRTFEELWRRLLELSFDHLETIAATSPDEGTPAIIAQVAALASPARQIRFAVLRAGLLWSRNREEALEILRPLDGFRDLPSLKNLWINPALVGELRSSSLPRLAEALETELRVRNQTRS